MEWTKIEDGLPPQNWPVIVKNGKSIIYSATYYRKKWHYWERKLHKVTDWKYFPNGEPKIPVKDLRAFFRRAEKYRNQMQKRNFTLKQNFL